MKKIILFLLIFSLILPLQTLGNGIYKINGVEEFMTQEQKEQLELITRGFDLKCRDIKETDYPTIFIPGILASWYSEYGFEENKVKRWIPDPITHVYDPLFYTFRQNGYTLEDVFYEDEFNVKIEGNPKGALYLFGYDWKKDNTVTATLLTQLIGKILDEYEKQNGCDIEKVNIIAHSMGGLVARSMLEDMCVKSYQDNNSKYNVVGLNIEENGKIEQRNGKLFSPETIPCTNPIDAYKPIKVNKFITIATPHRGSPKAFPIWEKGDINMTDGFVMGQVLKYQFFNVTNHGFYDTIHGYSESVPNGAVSVGQLLPDISKVNSYNTKLQYIHKKNIHISPVNYPKNSFLETLNAEENINKIWDKVDSFISYYSTITGDNGSNNIVSFTIPEKVLVGIDEDIDGPDKGIYIDEITEETFGRDIYEKYPYWTNRQLYKMSTVYRNSTGLGGDGTVPTYNLRLVPNDSIDGKEIKNTKFESREIKCYQNISYLYKDGNEARDYRGFGEKDMYEVCSHTNMPIATAIKVYEDISEKKKEGSMREILMLYIGHADYTLGTLYPLIYGIENQANMQSIFGIFRKNVQSQDIPYTDRFSIDVSGGKIDQVNSVIAYEVLSPINILITDSEGRRIGIDPDTGRIINEIPGAWTSGDTEGSNEPEFFIIPQTGTGKVEHTIETFATGEGEYHIEARKIDLGDESQESSDESQEGGITELFTIAGNAQEGFGEEYKITSTQQSDYSYAQTSDYPPIITTGKDTYTTLEESVVLRYSIKGKNQGVELIKYTLKDAEGKSIQEVTQDITGKLDITLPQVGDYTLDLELLDIKKKQIENTKTTTLKLTRTTDWREEDQAYQEKSESAKTGEDYETLIQEYGERRKKGVVIDLWSWFGD